MDRSIRCHEPPYGGDRDIRSDLSCRRLRRLVFFSRPHHGLAPLTRGYTLCAHIRGRLGLHDFGISILGFGFPPADAGGIMVAPRGGAAGTWGGSKGLTRVCNMRHNRRAFGGACFTRADFIPNPSTGSGYASTCSYHYFTCSARADMIPNLRVRQTEVCRTRKRSERFFAIATKPPRPLYFRMPSQTSQDIALYPPLPPMRIPSHSTQIRSVFGRATTRKPLLLLRSVGVFLLRFAERVLLPLLFQEPPRNTRDQACPYFVQPFTKA